MEAPPLPNADEGNADAMCCDNSANCWSNAETAGIMHDYRRYIPALARRRRRIVNNRPTMTIACELEIRQRVVSIEVQCDVIGSIGYRQDTIGIAIMDGVEVDALEIDLIRAGKSAISGKIEYHSVERGWFIKLQHSRGATKSN